MIFSFHCQQKIFSAPAHYHSTSQMLTVVCKFTLKNPFLKGYVYTNIYIIVFISNTKSIPAITMETIKGILLYVHCRPLFVNYCLVMFFLYILFYNLNFIYISYHEVKNRRVASIYNSVGIKQKIHKNMVLYYCIKDVCQLPKHFIAN